MSVNPYIIQRRVKSVSPAVPSRTVTPEGEVIIEPAARRLIETPFEEKVGYNAQIIPLSRPPKSFAFVVTTTPKPIIEPPHIWPYLISNPSLLVGVTSSLILYAGTVNSAGNSAPVGVANYLKAHFHLEVTAVTGSWDFYAQSLVPGTITWADTQAIFSGIDAVGAYYANIGEYGLVTDLMVRWVPVTPGSITFSITVSLKEGVTGSAGGLSRAIFIGGNDVTPDSGLPVFEGQSIVVMPGPDVSLWAVAYVDIPIKVFVL